MTSRLDSGGPRMPDARRLRTATLAMIWVLALPACTSLPADIDAPTRAQRDAALQRPESVQVADLDLLALTPEMKEFVKTAVPWRSRPEHRLDVLFRTLGQPGVRKIEYDARANLTAPEVFRQQRANCLSFAALFVALARDAGFHARFQKVEVPPQWTQSNNDIVVRYQHVNSIVSIENHRHYVAEFQRERFDMRMPRRAISDEHAESLFYSNLGADYLFEDDLDHAIAYFIEAIERHPKNESAWVNLGVARYKQGRTDLAEVAYRETLRLDPYNNVALINLAAILEGRGEIEMALALRERARRERNRNPYYHYGLAQIALDAGDPGGAQQHLKAALRRDDEEHRFHYLMAQILRELGETDAGRRSLERAEKTALDEHFKRRYRAALSVWPRETRLQ